MKRFRRWVFNGVAALSLLACVSTTVMWVQSHWRDHGIIFGFNNGKFLRIVDCPDRVEISYNREVLDGLYPCYGEHEFIHESWQAGTLDGAMAEEWGTDFRRINAELDFSSDHGPWGWDVAFTSSCVVIVGLTAILPMIWALRYIRRQRIDQNGMCTRCGYDLCATPDRCPECGAVPAKA